MPGRAPGSPAGAQGWARWLGNPAGMLHSHGHRHRAGRAYARAAHQRPEPARCTQPCHSRVHLAITVTSVLCVARPQSCMMCPEQHEARMHAYRKKEAQVLPRNGAKTS